MPRGSYNILEVTPKRIVYEAKITMHSGDTFGITIPVSLRERFNLHEWVKVTLEKKGRGEGVGERG